MNQYKIKFNIFLYINIVNFIVLNFIIIYYYLNLVKLKKKDNYY